MGEEERIVEAVREAEEAWQAERDSLNDQLDDAHERIAELERAIDEAIDALRAR